MTSIPIDTYYRDAYKLAFDNSKSLFKIADISANESEFGIACSLSILAAEESIKGIFLLFKHFNDKVDFNEFNKIFRDHKTKHDIFPETSGYFQIVVEMFYTKEGLYNYVLDIVNRLIPEQQRESFLDEYKIGLDSLKKLDSLKDIRLDAGIKINLDEEKKWWEKANLEKNRGLYVNKAEQGWHTPKSFTQEKYNDVRKHTYYIIENLERIIDLFDKSNA